MLDMTPIWKFAKNRNLDVTINDQRTLCVVN